MYCLMNKNTCIGTFQKSGDALDEEFCSFEAAEDKKLPLGFENINTWLEKRQAAKHREHLKKLMLECGCLDREGFIRVTHATSLNDSFWVKKDTEDVTWDDISLYRNEFNEVIARISFEGAGLFGMEFSSTTPEFSTEGAFEKCWIREDNAVYLYKRGSEGARNTGMEPYSEYYSSQIAAILCGNHVPYTLTSLHGKTASKCRLFTSEQEGFVPLSSVFHRKATPRELLAFYSGIGSEEAFRRMVILDAVIFNTDRHMGNHGVIIDNDTLEILRMAPVFDNNQALLPYAEQEDFKNIGDYLALKSPRIGEDFVNIAKSLLTGSIRSDLINMHGFRFSGKPDGKFTAARLSAMESLINRQIMGILDKSKLYTSAVFEPGGKNSVLKKLEENRKKINAPETRANNRDRRESSEDAR